MKVFTILRHISPLHHCDVVCLGKYDSSLLEQLRLDLPELGAVKIFPEPRKRARILSSILGVLRLNPFSFARFTSKPMVAWVRKAQHDKRYDVIHYDIVNMAKYHDAEAKCASVHSPNDATSQVYFRLAYFARSWPSRLSLRLSAILLRRFEKAYYANFSKIHVVSENDKNYLKRIVPMADVEVIPISSGYSFDLFNSQLIRRQVTAPVVTVCGNLGNIAIANGFRLFLDEVLPRLLYRFPELQVRVLGNKISPGLLAHIKTYSQIECHYWVDDFESFLTESDLILIPDLAGAPGAKTRVVQAMALGLAVVGSKAGFEGVPVINGIHGMIYNSASECLRIILKLLSDPLLRKHLGSEAASLAAKNYSLDVIGPKFEALYKQAYKRNILKVIKL